MLALLCASEATKPSEVTALTMMSFIVTTVLSSREAISLSLYSLQSRYLSPSWVIITSALLAKVAPLNTKASSRGLSIAPSRILSVTEIVTSIVPVPEAGVTVTHSGASVTQSASAYTVIIFSDAPLASKFKALALVNTALESVLSSSLQLHRRFIDSNRASVII